MAKIFGERIKELREARGLLQRQVASLLDIDAPLFSKIERGERVAKKGLVGNLAEILKVEKEQLLTLWLADQVFEVVKNEEVADKALKSVSLTINSDKKKK